MCKKKKKINKVAHVKISKKLRTHQLEKKRQSINRKKGNIQIGHTTE